MPPFLNNLLKNAQNVKLEVWFSHKVSRISDSQDISFCGMFSEIFSAASDLFFYLLIVSFEEGLLYI